VEPADGFAAYQLAQDYGGLPAGTAMRRRADGKFVPFNVLVEPAQGSPYGDGWPEAVVQAAADADSGASPGGILTVPHGVTFEPRVDAVINALDRLAWLLSVPHEMRQFLQDVAAASVDGDTEKMADHLAVFRDWVQDNLGADDFISVESMPLAAGDVFMVSYSLPDFGSPDYGKPVEQSAVHARACELRDAICVMMDRLNRPCVGMVRCENRWVSTSVLSREQLHAMNLLNLKDLVDLIRGDQEVFVAHPPHIYTVDVAIAHVKHCIKRLKQERDAALKLVQEKGRYNPASSRRAVAMLDKERDAATARAIQAVEEAGRHGLIDSYQRGELIARIKGS
jgi:hypothetical protein